MLRQPILSALATLFLFSALAAYGAVTPSPAAVSVLPTQTSAPVRLTLTYAPSSVVGSGTLAALLPAPLLGNTRVTPTPVTYSAPRGSTTTSTVVRFVTTAATPPGTWRVTFRDATLGAGSGTVTLIVREPSVSASLVPSSVVLEAGGGALPVTIVTSAGPGFTSPIRYSFEGLPVFIDAGDAGLALPPAFAPITSSFSAAAAAPTGTYSGVLRGRTGSRIVTSAPVTVRIVAPSPIIDRIAPQRVVAGARSQVVRLVGRNFEPGARLESDLSQVRVDDLRVLSPGLAVATVTVFRRQKAAAAGLRLTNPGGQTTIRPAILAVLPPQSLGAPLAITGVAVVHPRPGAQVAVGEALRPHGLITAAGTGTLTGAWLLDGVPFDRFTVRAVGGRSVTVTARIPLPLRAQGRHELSLQVDGPQALRSPAIPVIQTLRRASNLRLLGPPDSAIAGPGPVRLSWSLVPGATAYLVEVRAAQGDLQTYSTAEADLRFDREDFSEAGPLAWRVRPLFAGGAEGTATEWSRLGFISETAGVPAEIGPLGKTLFRSTLQRTLDNEPEQNQGQEPFSWSVNAEGSATEHGGAEPADPTETRLALSGQLAREEGRATFKATGDLSFRWLLKENDEEEGQESESWLAQARFGLPENGDGPSAGIDLQAGYGAPRFQEGLQLFDSGLAQGGGEVRWELPGSLSVSFYHSFDAELGQIAATSFEEDLKLEGAALQIGDDEGPGQLRLIGLQTERSAGDLSLARDGQLVGAFARLKLGGHTLEGEGGRGRSESTADAFEEPSVGTEEGNAYRLGLSGSLGELSYGLDLRRVEAGYSNPASLDFSEAGPADRDSVELTLSRFLGPVIAGLRLRQDKGGDAFGPPGRLRNGEITLSGNPGDVFSFSLSGSLTETDAEADDTLFLPATELRSRSFRLSLAETTGGIQLTQEASVDFQEDALDPLQDTTTTYMSLGASGSVGTTFNLAAAISETRIESADDFLGRTDSWTASLQPSWEIHRAHLRVAPYLAYSESRGDRLELDNTSELGQLTVGWNPPWVDSLLALELSARWIRNDSFGLDPRPDFERSYSAVFTLRWNGD